MKFARQRINFITQNVRTIVILIAGIPLLVTAADLPELKEQIDATARPLGTGSCKTTRTGVWKVEGGVVIEIKKPPNNCLFQTLELVVGEQSIKMSAVDNSFYRGRRNSWEPVTYTWYRGDSGKLFFATDIKVEVTNIRGISEVGCNSGNCLEEEGARK
jgi:hypothetical protein